MWRLLEFNLKPIEKEVTTRDKIYSQVKHAILNGQISSDENFTEVQLASSLNTSRTPVRAALQDIVNEGLLVSIPRKGFEVRQVSKNEQEQIFLLRIAMESEVLKRTALQITDSQIDVLKQIYEEQHRAILSQDRIKFIQLDQRFHLNIIRFSGFVMIEEVLNKLLHLSQLIGLKAVSKEGRFDTVLLEHKNIIESLEQRDPELASKEMTKHLKNTNEILLQMEE